MKTKRRREKENTRNTYNLYGLGLSKPLSPFFLFILAGSNPVGGMKRLCGLPQGGGALPGCGTSRSPAPCSQAARPGLPRRPRPAPPGAPLPTRSPRSRPRSFPELRSRRCSFQPLFKATMSGLIPCHLRPPTSAEVGRRRGPEVCKWAGLERYCRD